MFQRKTMIVLYLLVFAAFTNLSNFTVEKFALPLLPSLFALAIGALFFDIMTAKSYPMDNYRGPEAYVINLFLLTFLTMGLINADMTRAIDPEIYHLTTGLILFHLMLWYVQKEEELEGILLVVVLCGPLLALQGFYQYFQDMSVAVLDYHVRAGGWWVNPNEYALMLNLIYLVSFYFLEKKRIAFSIIGGLAQVTTGAGVLISLSRGGIVIFGLITLLGLKTFWRHKVYLIILILIVLLTYQFILTNITGIELLRNTHLDNLLSFYTERFTPWSDENNGDFSNGRLGAAVTGLKIYSEHPVVGAGFGNVLDYAYIFSNIRIYSHNLYVEILASSGPLPLLCYLFMLGYLWLFIPKKAGVKTDVGKILGWFIIALSGMGMFSHSLMYMKPIWVVLALFPVYSQLTKKGKVFPDQNECA